MRKDAGWKHRTPIQKLQDKVAKGVKDYPKDNKKDLELVKRYQAGDREAGMELVNNYLDFISDIYKHPHNPPRMKAEGKGKLFELPYTNEYDREDILQEILTQFLILIEEYDESLGRPFQALIKGKLFLRFHNNFYKEFFTTKKKELEFDDDLEGYYERMSQAMEEIKEEIDLKKRPSEHLELYNSLDQLSKRQREVVELSVLKGWNATVISEELGIAPSSVRNHLKAGLDRLKNLMGAG